MNQMSSKKQEIKNRYNDLGGRIYDIRYTEEQNNKYNKTLQKITLNKTDIILDNGCGTGLLLKRLQQHTIGLDLSNKLLKKARKRTTQKTTTNLIQADSETLPLRNKTFNQIFSFTVIQNIPDPIKALNEMKRVSRKNSQTVITTLKKAFNKKQITAIFEKSNMKITSIYSEENTNDWIILVKNN